ncbi:permease [Candidatus Woesearchaeota archaeon]|nr:permease [Candidatus Woesearchaeota archaeon]
MAYLEYPLQWLLQNALNIAPESRLGQSISFFIYDSIKILLLLFVLIAIMGFIRTYIPQNRVKNWLGKSRGTGNLAAALFGAMTPFCSCSSIPIFLSFLEAGVPLGVSLSFLITSPLVNEYLAVLMLGFFGWKITLAYIASGIFIGVISGMILGKLGLERYLVKDLIAKSSKVKERRYRSIKQRIRFGLDEAKSIISKLWLWILVGVGIGALIHNYVPEDFVHMVISRGGAMTVPLATIIGVPIYGSCAAIVPIAVVLFNKGISLGAVLAFTMAVSALSLPEAVILRRAMKLQLIGIFFGTVTLGIILLGYIFNYLAHIL